MKRGRQVGVLSTCRACGVKGHASRNGLCSAVYLAARLVIETGCTGREAARQVGCSPQAVTERLLRGEGYSLRAAGRVKKINVLRKQIADLQASISGGGE